MWFVSEVGLLVVCSMGVMPAKDKKKEKKSPKNMDTECFFLTIKVNPLIAMTANCFYFVFLKQIFRKITLQTLTAGDFFFFFLMEINLSC